MENQTPLNNDPAKLKTGVVETEKDLNNQVATPEINDPLSNPNGFKLHADGRAELTATGCYKDLAKSFSTRKKWGYLFVLALFQISQNFNASVYPNAVAKVSQFYGVSEQAARVPQCLFLVCYAFGGEFWAPVSEEWGRFPTLALSMLLVNIWQIPCALAPNFATIVVCRALAGFSSAAGSVTVGMIADLYTEDEHQYAIAFLSFASMAISAIAPIVGGYLDTFLPFFWNFWVQLILGAFCSLVHLVFIRETSETVLIDRAAKRMRKDGTQIWGPGEIVDFDFKRLLRIQARPFVMFFTEPIVFCLSMLSGFSDSLIFTFLQSYGMVFEQWGFNNIQIGLCFISLLIGYILAYISFLPFIHNNQQKHKRDGFLVPEARLYWLLWLAPLMPLGLFGFAWSSLGPSACPYWVPLLFGGCVAIANYGIYMGTIDYMVASYGKYSASATGGNALARDFLAGIAAMYSVPFYENIGGKNYRFHLEWPSTILGVIGIITIIPLYVFYVLGPKARMSSPMSKEVLLEAAASGGPPPPAELREDMLEAGDRRAE